MTTPSPLDEIDTTVQELRFEQHHRAFTHKLAHVVSAIGAIPDSPPQGFTADAPEPCTRSGGGWKRSKLVPALRERT